MNKQIKLLADVVTKRREQVLIKKVLREVFVG